MTKYAHSLFPLRLLRLLTAAALAGSVSAQATALVREGDILPDAPAGHVVTFLNNTAVNQAGGYAVTLNTDDGVTTLSHVWGNASGGAGSILRTEALVGTLNQTSFESFFGIDDSGQIAYSPSSDDTMSGGTGLDGVWLDDTVLALEDQPIPSLAGKVWRFASRPNVTGNGIPVWVGGINDVSGATEGNGLFMGLGATNLLKTGDVIAPLTDPLGATAADFDFRFSGMGTHWIIGVDTGGLSTEDFYILVDGAVVTLGSDLLGEDQPIPASSGGMTGENWDNFDFLGITEAGEYLVTGDTDGDTLTDEFVAINGVIVYREGDTVCGEVLTGSIEGAFLNENAQVAYIWDVEDGLGGSLEALYLEDKLLLKEGDPVDWDGDGFVDTNAVVDNFTGLSSVTIGPDSAVYFTADIDVSGTILEGAFRFAYGGLSADVYFLTASLGGTQSLCLDAGAANAGQLYWLFGSLSGTSPGINFQGMNLPLNLDNYTLFTVNKANGPILMNTLGLLDADGRATCSITLGPDPGLAGTTAHHAYGVFDPLPPLTLLDTSGAVSVVFVP